MATPATGAETGTPAAWSAIEEAHTDPIDDGPARPGSVERAEGHPGQQRRQCLPGEAALVLGRGVEQRQGGVDGGSRLAVAQVGADLAHDLDPLLDVEPLHATEPPGVLGRQAPELLLPGGEVILVFEREPQMMQHHGREGYFRIGGSIGDGGDLLESALDDPVEDAHRGGAPDGPAVVHTPSCRDPGFK